MASKKILGENERHYVLELKKCLTDEMVESEWASLPPPVFPIHHKALFQEWKQTHNAFLVGKNKASVTLTEWHSPFPPLKRVVSVCCIRKGNSTLTNINNWKGIRAPVPY